jgi:hypothetical protein
MESSSSMPRARLEKPMSGYLLLLMLLLLPALLVVANMGGCLAPWLFFCFLM